MELQFSEHFNVDSVTHGSQGTCLNLWNEGITEDSQLEKSFQTRGVTGILRC